MPIKLFKLLIKLVMIWKN